MANLLMKLKSLIPPFLHTTKIVVVVAVVFLCSLSYLLPSLRSPTQTFYTIPCNNINHNITLNFTARHTAGNLTTDDLTTISGHTFRPCKPEYVEYTPCEGRHDSLRFPRAQLEYRERHCPEKHQLLKCLVPAPPRYKVPFRWPESRDYAWFANVPHVELVNEKGGQNWVKVEGEKLRFPGGGTMFPGGASRYIDEIGRSIPVDDGSIRTAIDTGCGVASFGAYMLSREILTMSFAPKDTHEAQVWFALERGVPAMLGILATIRLPYPSRTFDMAHCSRCLIPWHLYDGAYLIEIDRILRPGGYWILSGPPINWKKHLKGWKRSTEDLKSEQTSIENLAKSLCWSKVAEKGDIAIWQKPINHIKCKEKVRNISDGPKFCSSQNADNAWYTKMDSCITPLPEVAGIGEISGGEVKKWPERLLALPPRIASGSLTGVTPEMFYADAELWRGRVGYYKNVITQFSEKGRYRNLLDMNAGFGGFSAALINDPVWVMNVVPTVVKVNTLGVIYERGLIGTYQDWCEALSTYPRTYDLIHADSLFTLYKDRCEMEDILLEMDRILRPLGRVIVRDDIDVLVQIKSIADGMNWKSRIADHEDGPLQREKLLLVEKTYWALSEQNRP